MRTEDQLHSRVLATLYLLAALVMLVLSIDNYRYGLYPLVYKSSLMTAALAGLAVYARVAWDSAHLNKASTWVLGLCMGVILFAALEHAIKAMYWFFAMTLLCFVALKHRQAMVIANAGGLLILLCLWAQEGLLPAAVFVAGFTLLVALASTYAQLQQQRNRTLVELEIRDPVTRAYNARHMEDTLAKELCRADRTGKALSLLALEIDYFPQIIDVHGPVTSQALLSDLSKKLSTTIRAGDSLYFDGKQTFYMMLPCTPSEGVVVIAERIRRSIEEGTWPEVDSMTASLGSTSYQLGQVETSPQSFINNANIALIEAQKNGHNRVCHH